MIRSISSVDQAVEQARQGQFDVACHTLRLHLQQNPDDEIGWLALAHISRDITEKFYCLDQVLQINPDNPTAKRRMKTWKRKINGKNPKIYSNGIVFFLLAFCLIPTVVAVVLIYNAYAVSGFEIVPNPISSPTIFFVSEVHSEDSSTNSQITVRPFSQLASSTETIRPEEISCTTPAPTETPLHISTQTLTLTPSPIITFTPTATLPAIAIIEKIEGHKQRLPLSCEANAATTWALYFGTKIDELAFFKQIPVSDNPEKGFVGDVRGDWGQIPPNPYGVYANPIAQLLRDNGLNAMSVHKLEWIDLQRQISAGRPVIVWVVGHTEKGAPLEYQATDGQILPVARFQHTVNVIGYNEQEDTVTILDGFIKYERPTEIFLQSWSVLGNMAIVWGP